MTHCSSAMGDARSGVPPGGQVEVVRGHQPVLWARLDSKPFADRVVRKFQLPVKGWRGR